MLKIRLTTHKKSNVLVDVWDVLKIFIREDRAAAYAVGTAMIYFSLKEDMYSHKKIYMYVQGVDGII